MQKKPERERRSPSKSPTKQRRQRPKKSSERESELLQKKLPLNLNRQPQDAIPSTPDKKAAPPPTQARARARAQALPERRDPSTDPEAYASQLRYNYERAKLYTEAKNVHYTTRIAYYSVQSLILGGLLASYGVQAFADLAECKSATTNADVTYNVKRSFQTCFYIHLAQFMQSSFLSRLFVLMPFANGGARYVDHTLANKLARIDKIVEQALRVAVFLMIIWQSHIVFKADFAQCYAHQKDLRLEGTWMLTLTILQAFFTAVFVLWSFFLMTFDQILEKLRREKYNGLNLRPGETPCRNEIPNSDPLGVNISNSSSTRRGNDEAHMQRIASRVRSHRDMAQQSQRSHQYQNQSEQEKEASQSRRYAQPYYHQHAIPQERWARDPTSQRSSRHPNHASAMSESDRRRLTFGVKTQRENEQWAIQEVDDENAYESCDYDDEEAAPLMKDEREKQYVRKLYATGTRSIRSDLSFNQNSLYIEYRPSVSRESPLPTVQNDCEPPLTSPQKRKAKDKVAMPSSPRGRAYDRQGREAILREIIMSGSADSRQ